MFVLQNHSDAPFFIAASGVSALLAAFAWQRRRLPMAPAFAAMMLGQSAWAMGSGLELLFADLPAKLLCLDLMNVGVATTPPSLLLFVLGFTGRNHWISLRSLALTFAFPLVTILITWTNPWHHLYYSSIRIEQFHGAWTGIEVRGPWFWLNVTYLYSLMTVATVLLFQAFLRSASLYRAQVSLLLLGVLLPWLVNALDLAGHSPIPQLDLTSMVFSVTGLMLVPGLLRLKILDLVPVARDLVIQGMRDAVIVLDPGIRIVDLNRAARELLDRPLNRIVAESATLAVHSWKELAKQLEDLAERSVEIPGPDATVGAVFDLRISRLNDGDQLVGWVLVLRDVTERKQAEQERERTAGAEAARAVAEATNRAKDRFLAVLSHELRTPLTPVLATVSAMLERDEVPEIRPTLEMIRRNVELEARLIDDLLDVTRIGRGALRVDPRTVDAHEVIHQAVDICLAEIEENRLALELNLSAVEHHVEADPARLQQVVWNLLRNAAKFTLPGGAVTLRSRNQPDLRPGGRPQLVIEIEDTGIGIEAEALSRIFEAFEQAESPRHHRSGLGLGLAIGRSLAEAHGGGLTAFSRGPGQGSTFVLELPTVPRPVDVEPAQAPAEAGLPRPQGLRVLLVEDNKDTLRYIAIVLRARGHQVTTAERLSDALQAANDPDLDLVISDIELPDGTGLELMRRLGDRGVPGVAMSGYGSEVDIKASREAGFSSHLTKPVDVSRLERAIETVTSVSRSTAVGE
jgi:signal transduction histidine kinase/CheY-like chemotaxis protein